MNFISSENRKRNSYLESIISETKRNIISNNGVKDRLQTSTLKSLSFRLDRLFIPDVKHGIVTIPKSKRVGNNTPIFTVGRGEEAVLGAGFDQMTPFQRQVLDKNFDSWRVNTVVKAAMHAYVAKELANAQRKIQSPATGEESWVVAQVSSVALWGDFSRFKPKNIGRDSRRLITGKAAIIFFPNTEGEFKPKLQDTGAQVHELIHIMQRQASPVLPSDPEKLRKVRLTRELEAYHTASFYEQGLFESDDPAYRDNLDVFGNTFIENIRAANMVSAHDPFKASGTIMKALAAERLDDIYTI